MEKWIQTVNTTQIYLWFSHGKDQLLHTLLPDSGIPLLACDHHEIITVTTKGNHSLVRVRDQRVLPGWNVEWNRYKQILLLITEQSLELIWEILWVSAFLRVKLSVKKHNIISSDLLWFSLCFSLLPVWTSGAKLLPNQEWNRSTWAVENYRAHVNMFYTVALLSVNIQESEAGNFIFRLQTPQHENHSRPVAQPKLWPIEPSRN